MTGALASPATAISPGISVGSRVNGDSPWNGDVAEVLIYDHALTNTEMNAVGKYLGNKYGIYNPNATWYTAGIFAPYSAEIIKNQWNEAQATAYINLQSNTSGVVTNGLLSWFHADSITGLANGAAVTSWIDSALGNTVTQGATGNQPTFVTNDVNGQAGVRFNGSQWLYNPNTLGQGANKDLTIVSVASSTNTGIGEYTTSLGGETNTTARASGYSNLEEQFITWNSDLAGGPVPNVNTFTTEATTLGTDLKTVNFYQNGTLSLTGALASSATAISPGISVGSRVNGNSSWNGDISEILIYDHALTTTEMGALGKYLGNKYGIYNPNATWYTSGIFAPYSAEIIKNQWNEAQATAYVDLQSNTSGVVTNGLLSWFHADSITGLANGAAVTSWIDSALGNTVTQSSTGNQPTFVTNDVNGQAGVRFNGSQWLYNPNTLGKGANKDLTIVSVAASTNTGIGEYTTSLGGETNTTVRASGYSNSEEQFITWNNDLAGGPVPNVNTFTTEATTLGADLKTVDFYQNGMLSSTGTLASAATAVSPGISIGSRVNGDSPWNGDISEILIYDHQLTAAEIQQVGTYLANKYALPYPPLAPPTISPAAGSYTTSVSVTLGGELAPTSIHYTIDGSTPTLSSPTYSTPITLPQSALVSAVAFLNGFSSVPAASQYYVNDPGQTGLPKPPTALTATVKSSTEIDLAWTLPTGLVTYQNTAIYRSVNGGGYILLSVLPANTTTYNDTTVQAGNTYSYYVGTVNQSGIASTVNSSSLSPTVPVTITITVTTPAGAVNLP